MGRVWSHPDEPLAFARRNMWRWGGRRAHAWAYILFRTGPQPHHGTHCDVPWLGYPSYSLGNGKWRRQRWSSHIIWVGPEALDHISGRGHLAIPLHPVPSRLLLAAVPSAMPPYLSKNIIKNRYIINAKLDGISWIDQCEKKEEDFFMDKLQCWICNHPQVINLPLTKL